MSTTYQHIRMSVVDASANVTVMYPETTGADVTISRPTGTNVPSGVTTAQGLANALAASAFTNPINDSATAASSTWSSNKINTGLTNIKVYVGTDGKIHFTNSAGSDSALSFNKASGTAGAAQVLAGYTFSNNSGTGLNGSMTNRGAWTPTNINPGGSVTVPAGYHNGSGKVTANANQNSGTYTASSRAASIDMGANNTYRYVNTNGVPNSNSGTYTYATNSTGATVDMGATNTYRYVNAGNVYTKGKADGVTTHTGTYTLTWDSDFGKTKDMGTTHTYRYISVPAKPTSLIKGFSLYTGSNVYFTAGIANSDPNSEMVLSQNTASPSVSLDGITLTVAYVDNTYHKVTFHSTKAGKLYLNGTLTKTWTSSDLTDYTFTGNWNQCTFTFKVISS